MLKKIASIHKIVHLHTQNKQMKKIYLLIVLVISVTIVSAQTKIAVKAGWNVSTARVHYMDEPNQKDIKQPNFYKNGFGIAVLFKTQFDDILHFSPTIGYNLRGYSYKPVSGDTSEYDNTIHYIDIVPALSADFPVGERKNTFVISAGPQLGIAVAGTEKITRAGVTTSKKMKINVDGEYGMFDLGISTGIGFHTPKMFVEAGFQLGLANINNDFELDGRNIRNRMLSLSFGYYLK